MKKLLILTAALGLCSANLQADGWISFFNSLSTLVQTNNGYAGGIASLATKVELFYQPSGGIAPASIFDLNGFVNLGAWEQTTGLNGNPITLGPLPGRFSGGTQSTGSDVAAGANAWFTVVGWDGGWSSIQQAYINGADVGESTVFELTTGGGGTPPTIPVPLTASRPGTGFVAGTPFNGIIIGTPEPSVIALGCLGTAALVFLRRNKRSKSL